MSCDSIKFKVIRDKITRNLHLQIYRPYGDNNELMLIDQFNEMTDKELKYLTEYLLGLFQKKRENS
jgi:hypothetical protein